MPMRPHVLPIFGLLLLRGILAGPVMGVLQGELFCTESVPQSCCPKPCSDTGDGTDCGPCEGLIFVENRTVLSPRDGNPDAVTLPPAGEAVPAMVPAPRPAPPGARWATGTPLPPLLALTRLRTTTLLC